MAKTVVISVRVPEDVVKRLKEKGKKPSEIAKKALIMASVEEEIKWLNRRAKQIPFPSWKELKKMIEEGRA